MMRTTLPSRDEIGPDTPLRLGVAAALAFPGDEMAASGLRLEAARGRLMIERIAVTLLDENSASPRTRRSPFAGRRRARTAAGLSK